MQNLNHNNCKTIQRPEKKSLSKDVAEAGRSVQPIFIGVSLLFERTYEGILQATGQYKYVFASAYPEVSWLYLNLVIHKSTSKKESSNQVGREELQTRAWGADQTRSSKIVGYWLHQAYSIPNIVLLRNKSGQIWCCRLIDNNKACQKDESSLPSIDMLATLVVDVLLYGRIY